MFLQPKSLLLIVLTGLIPGIALAALAGVNYNSVPSQNQATTSAVVAASDPGPAPANASSSTGTPTQSGNTNAVSSILHPPPKDKKTTDYPEPMQIEDIETRIMDNSINAYRGPCACPYSKNSDGFECGVEAAYYKPGGFRIYCYPEDIRGQLDIFYRKTH